MENEVKNQASLFLVLDEALKNREANLLTLLSPHFLIWKMKELNIITLRYNSINIKYANLMLIVLYRFSF